MLVQNVIESKGRQVIVLDDQATVSEAVAKLVQNNIGSLPIVDQQGRLIGILSERDIMRLIHNRGETFGRIPVVDVMTANPITCSPRDDVDDVMGKMSERHIAKIPVVEDGEIVGIISVGDVVKVMYDKVHTENQHLLSYIHGV